MSAELGPCYAPAMPRSTRRGIGDPTETPAVMWNYRRANRFNNTWPQMLDRKKYVARVFFALSVLLYIACLPFSSFCTGTSGCNDHPSWSVLVLGWLGGGGWSNWTWWANPILFLGWLCFAFSATAAKRWAAALSYFSLSLALSFLLAKTVVTNEGGVALNIVSYELGYWLWIASMGCFAFSATISLFDTAQ